MKFLKFHLKNYKGIGSVEIEMSQSCAVCLIGMNEAGKSTILRGLEDVGRLCSGGEILNGRRNNIRPASEFTGEIVLSADILFEGTADLDAISPDEDADEEERVIVQNIKRLIAEREKVNVKFIFPYANSKPEKMRTKIRIDGAKKDVDRKYPILRAIEDRIPLVIYHDDVMFSAPEVIRFASESLEQANAEKVRTDDNLNSSANILWKDMFSDILTGALANEGSKDTWSFQEDIVDEIARGDLDETNLERRLDRMSAYLNNTITNQWMDVNGKRTFDEIRITPALGNAGDFNDFRLTVYSKGIRFPLADRSKGAQWYFCFKILTEVKSTRMENGVIFLLDEPASNLHSSNQEKIYETIRDLNNDTGISIIYTTHAPTLIGLNEDELNSTHLVVNKFLESRDINSSGKIESKKVCDIKEGTLKRHGLYAHAIVPLVHRAVIDDLTEKSSKPKQGANQILDTLKKLASKPNFELSLSSIRTILQLLQ